MWWAKYYLFWLVTVKIWKLWTVNNMLVVIREAKKLFFVICDNSWSNSFHEKLLTEDLQSNLISLAALNMTNLFKCWSSSYKKVLSSKENIGMVAWHEVRKKFTVLRFSKPRNLFHFHVNYNEGRNGNINYCDSLFVLKEISWSMKL